MIIGSIVWINGNWWSDKCYEIMGWTESGYPILDPVRFDFSNKMYFRSHEPFIHKSSKELFVWRN